MRKYLRADGTERDLPEPLYTRQAADMIGASMVEAMQGVGPHRDHVLIFDDEAHGKGRPYNPRATALYRAAVNDTVGANVIRGDAIVLPLSDFGGA